MIGCFIYFFLSRSFTHGRCSWHKSREASHVPRNYYIICLEAGHVSKRALNQTEEGGRGWDNFVPKTKGKVPWGGRLRRSGVQLEKSCQTRRRFLLGGNKNSRSVETELVMISAMESLTGSLCQESNWGYLVCDYRITGFSKEDNPMNLLLQRF